MSYPAYSDYKDSGVEWLGEVPAHWEIKHLKFIAFLEAGQSPSAHEVREGMEGLPFLQGNADFGQINPSPRQSCDVAPKKAEEGDILFSVRAPVGAMNLADQRYGIGRGLCAIRPLNKSDKDYLFYLIWATRQGLHAVATGSTYAAISSAQLGEHISLVPSATEQAQIATFLDHETARIDALVEEQQRLIALLKEKRQAVISHAVTKGLDPDVPMKDSGVEWLGEVPEHWVVGPLRWYATIQGGIAKGKNYDSETPTVELPYLRVANVQDGYVDLSTVKTVEVAISEVGRYRLQAGDVLMNEGGDNDKLGRGTVWEGEVADCLHQNHVFAIRPNQYLLPHWLSMFTRSNSARAYFYLYSKQSTNLASISSSSVMSCPLPLPPVEEQRELLDFLTVETARLDDLMHEGIKTIDLLQERRSALISATVTGKIDVRGWQPPEGAEAKETSQQEAV